MYPLLSQAIEAKKFDTRIYERNVRREKVSQAEVDAMVKALEDSEANAEYIPASIDLVQD
ncbi:MAG: hypothetical protein KA715_11575 [Xanthomonadaceae bacterium]|nr:hypothetical protein [Xanthomonadaceae bacterium]